MKRINLAKYGFIRSPKEDFSDDLTNLSNYLIPVEILASNGQYCLVNTTLQSGQRVCVIDQKLMEIIES